MLSVFTFMHTFLLCNVYLARNISEVNIINLLPFLVETTSTYLLFILKIFLFTITDESTGTVSAVLMTLLSGLYSLMGSPEYLSVVLLSAFLFIYSMGMTLFSRKRAYINLGRGGTPATWFGYIRITVLEFFRVDKHQPMASNGGGFLSSLPRRAGLRPNVVGIATSRQDCIPTAGPIATHADFVTGITAFAATNPTKLEIKAPSRPYSPNSPPLPPSRNSATKLAIPTKKTAACTSSCIPPTPRP